MHRLKIDIWKAGIAIAGLLLLLVFMVWVPVSAGAYEGVSGLATPVVGTVQASPTVNVTATMTALQEDKLRQEIQQLKNQNEPDLLGWLRTNAAILLSTLVVVIGGLIGFFRWFGDRRDAHDKDLKAQAEERFKTAVAALGDEKEGVQLGGAILLRSFLNKDDKEIYGRYYTQIFDLAVAYLRLPRTSLPTEDPNTPLPLTPLSKALIVIFKEVFPLARSQNDKRNWQSLDASNIRLDNAYLRGANLERIWMPKAFLQKVDLMNVDLNGSFLNDTNFCGACLNFTNLSEAFLNRANLSDTLIIEANLSKAKFGVANLMRADLEGANLSAANLSWANLDGANLLGTDLSGTNLSWTNLSRANPEEAQSLKGTNLHGVKGLTEEQKDACKAKGAIIDEAPTASSPQSPVAPSQPSQSTNVQNQSAPPAQVNTPTPSTDGSSATSSQSSEKS